jgi:hypothetical protein
MPIETTPDEQFRELADSFIRLANQQCDSQLSNLSPGRVNAALMYASARFSAFLVASSMASAAELEAEKPNALPYFCAEFEKMLQEHLTDHVDNFERYCEASSADAKPHKLHS